MEGRGGGYGSGEALESKSWTQVRWENVREMAIKPISGNAKDGGGRPMLRGGSRVAIKSGLGGTKANGRRKRPGER